MQTEHGNLLYTQSALGLFEIRTWALLSPVLFAAKTARPKEPGQKPGQPEKKNETYLIGVGGTILYHWRC